MIAVLIYGIGGFIEALIGLRFILQLLGANPLNGFVEFVYHWSQPFVTPFANVLNREITTAAPGTIFNGMFDLAALVAFIVIGIIIAILGFAFTRKHVS